jgi:putative ABC transport system permease protein
METLREALESIVRFRQRALATSFGVFWGVFIVTVLQAGGQGLREGLTHLYGDNAKSIVWIWSDRTSLAYHGLAPGRSVPLRLSELELLEHELPELENLSPRLSLPATTQVSHGLRSANPPVIAVYPPYALMEQVIMQRGRWLNPLDLRDRRHVAVVGVAALPPLFGAEDPIGQRIAIGGTPFEVVGVFDDTGGGLEAQRVFVPFSAVATAGAKDQRVQVVVGTLRDDAAIAETRYKIRTLLAFSLGIAPGDERAVGAFFAAEQYRRLLVLMHGIGIAIALVGLGTLLSGAVGVSNVLFVTVRERAQEFGIRRALGASAASIVRLVLTEACLLSGLAGAVGLAAAAFAVHAAREAGIETEYFRDPHIDFTATWLTLGALCASALVAGWFPAREAARMHPVEALTRL